MLSTAGGRAGSLRPTCGDLCADEMSCDEKDKLLMIDMKAVVARTGNCLPANTTAPFGPNNFPTCILGQIYYDRAPVQ
jgi:hypothetical protein